MVNRLRSAFTRSSGGAGSGEDWVVFPGAGRRLGRRQQDSSVGDLEDDEGLDTEDARLNDAERRLLNDMRRVGLA